MLEQFVSNVARKQKLRLPKLPSNKKQPRKKRLKRKQRTMGSEIQWLFEKLDLSLSRIWRVRKEQTWNRKQRTIWAKTMAAPAVVRLPVFKPQVGDLKSGQEGMWKNSKYLQIRLTVIWSNIRCFLESHLSGLTQRNFEIYFVFL